MKRCPEGKILNPKTNRCVDENGKIGKEIRRSQRHSPNRKRCPDGKLLNPKTNRCVDENGKIGKEIKEMNRSSRSSPVKRRRSIKRRSSPVKRYSPVIRSTPVKKRSSPRIKSNPRRSTSDCILRSNLKLKEHQKKVIEHLKHHRGLIVVHNVGSGKTLTAVTASQCYLDDHPDNQVVVITPKSLRTNFKKEMERYGVTDFSRYKFYGYQSFVNAKVDCKKTMLIIDEAHNLRTEIVESKKKEKRDKGGRPLHTIACAQKADKVLLLTATPIVNGISDLTNLIRMVTGKNLSEIIKNIDKKKLDVEVLFEVIKNTFSMFSAPVNNDKYPAAIEKNIFLTMDPEYLESYIQIEENNMEVLRKMGLDPEKKLQTFFTSMRIGSNALDSERTPKVIWIMNRILKHPKRKYVIFSHFLKAGVKLLMAYLDNNGLSYAHIDGSLSVNKRKEAVDNYNSGDVNILLITKAGGEGLDLKNTNEIIIMEPGWNQTEIDQVIGRGVRYESHETLTPRSRKVTIFKLFLIKPDENTECLCDYKKVCKRCLDESETISYKQGEEIKSVDFYLFLYSIKKQREINRMLNLLRLSSIEENDVLPDDLPEFHFEWDIIEKPNDNTVLYEIISAKADSAYAKADLKKKVEFGYDEIIIYFKGAATYDNKLYSIKDYEQHFDIENEFEYDKSGTFRGPDPIVVSTRDLTTGDVLTLIYNAYNQKVTEDQIKSWKKITGVSVSVDEKMSYFLKWERAFYGLRQQHNLVFVDTTWIDPRPGYILKSIN